MGNSWTAKGEKKKKTFFEFEFGSNSPKTRVRGMDGGNDRVRRVRLVLYGRRRHETRGEKKGNPSASAVNNNNYNNKFIYTFTQRNGREKKTVFFFVYTSARANFFFFVSLLT